MKRLQLLVLSVLCFSAGLQSQELRVEDGYCLISSPEEMEVFAQRVNGGESSLNGRLTAPLDFEGVGHTPIGSPSVPFQGSFDGQLFPINNINAMLFGVVHGAQITRIAIESGTATENTAYAGATGSIVGWAEPDDLSSLTQSYSKADVIGGGQDAGGLCGKFVGLIENCLFAGTVRSNATTGGISGSSNENNGPIHARRCLIVGTIEGGANTGALIGWQHDTSTTSNCYVINTAPANMQAHAGGENLNNKRVTAEELATGQYAYALNGFSSENPVWFQKIGTDPLPQLTGTDVVYATGHEQCNGEPYGDMTYSNTPGKPERDPHDFVNGICDLCGAIMEGYVPVVDGWYELGTPDAVEFFASLVNLGHTDIKGRLTAPIDFAAVQHTPIGSKNKPFAGEFDGQLQPITNLNAMFFGSVNAATVTGIAIESGDITSNPQYADHTASIIGATTTTNLSSLTRSYSKANINSTQGDAGGLVGKFAGIIEDCLYAGAIVGTTTAAGIAGSSNENDGPVTARHCLVIMENPVQTTSSYKGAFIGWQHDTSHFIDCFATQSAGDLVGHAGGANTGCASVTAEDLATGRYAYTLNGFSSADPVWYQQIGTDAYPVLTGTAVVYGSGREHCNGDAYDGFTYSNTPGGTTTRDTHNFVEGKCTYCGTTLDNFVPLVDGWYEINSAAAFEWYTSYVNSGHADAKGRLTGEIDFAGYSHTPIGNSALPFQGSFDGQLYPIYNLDAMLFGVVNGAQLTRIAIESGTITSMPDVAGATGSIVGWAQVDVPSSLTQSYSRADVTTTSGDAGGLCGKFVGTLKDCFFAGSLSCSHTTGGLVGSSNEDNGPITASGCYTFTRGAIKGEGATGALIGWEHGNSTFTNCIAVETDGPLFSHVDGVNTNCIHMSEEEFFSGAVTYALNGGKLADVKWFQTLNSDDYPVLDNTHGLVYRKTDGTYGDVHDQASFEEMRSELLTGYTDVVAEKALIDEWAERIQLMNSINTLSEFLEEYALLEDLKGVIEESIRNYASYMAAVEEIMAYRDEHYEELMGPHFDTLERYLDEDVEPGDEFPHGSYSIIIDQCLLSITEIQEEIEYAKHLLENAIKYATTIREVTQMLQNPTLVEGDAGWTFSYGNSTSGAAGGDNFYVRETWGNTFDMHQTLTDLQNGIYELTVNASFRNFGDYTNLNQASFVYANGNQVYTMMDPEDVISAEDAVDGVNCNLSEGHGLVDYVLYGETEEPVGYSPHGPEGYGFAFQAGRYMNRIVCEVTDGTLTVGLRTPGCGGIVGTWAGNFRLYYCGEKETASETGIMMQTIKGQVARAKTLLEDYQFRTDEFYAEAPNFSADLKERLQAAIDAADTATDADSQLALIETFSALFQEVYECKQAYAAYIRELESFASALYDAALLSGTDADAFEALQASIWEKYENGAWSLEAARLMEELNSSSFAPLIYGSEPEIIDGVCQLSVASEVVWFARHTNAGEQLNGVLTAPIDFSEAVMIPVGSPTSPFQGSFDGQLFPISNVSTMLFGVVNGAQITRIAIESGTATENTAYASATGSIVGWANADALSSLTQSYSKADVIGGGQDVGGLCGKFAGTIEDCFFAGYLSGNATMGGISGSSNEDNGPITATRCFIYPLSPLDSHSNVGAFIGYEHNTSHVNDCYAINEIGVDLFGHVGTGGNTGNKLISSDDFASGMVAFALNGGRTPVIWFQTLGEDPYPVLDATRSVVLKAEDGTYYNSVVAVETVKNSQSATESGEVFDIAGRKVMDAASKRGLPKGIYVVNGRKVLVK